MVALALAQKGVTAMKTSRVALVIRFALLGLAVTMAMQVVSAPALADDCTAACQVPYNSCLLSSATSYNLCEATAESALNSCQSAAELNFEINVDIYCNGGSSTACVEYFEIRLFDDYAACQQIYSDNVAVCANRQATADAICQANLQSCEESCP